MQSPLESPSARRPRPWLRALALAAGLSFACAASAGNLDEANQQFKAGQHAKALELVDKHLAGQPKDPQGRFLKGLILTAQNKQTEAIAIFRKLTEDQPDWPQPYNNLAVLYAQQKQYEKAKEVLEQAIRTDKNYATAHENLGYIYSRLASQAYEKALQINSSESAGQPRLTMINDLNVSKPVPPPTVVASAKPVETPKPAPAQIIEPPPPAAKPVVEAKPAESTPHPVTAPAAAKPASLDSEIAAAIDGWLAAWSKKDVKGYLAHYAQDFETPRGLSRKDWETERAQRVGKPGQIEVGRDKLAIKVEGDKATVHFRQSYRSASFKSSSGKTLVLVKRDGKWLILKEQAG